MSNVVLLDREAHRKLRVHSHAAAHYGDNQRFVAVVVNEFPTLAMHYPILFSKDSDTGQFFCGAMLAAFRAFRNSLRKSPLVMSCSAPVTPPLAASSQHTSLVAAPDRRR
jgi:hypothetical protein